MSHYDILIQRLNKLKSINQAVILMPTISLIILVVLWYHNTHLISNLYLLFFIALLTLPLGFFVKFAIRQVVSPYKALLDEIDKIKLEANSLTHSVDAVYNKYRLRNKGEQFKRAYDLIGKGINECEEILAVGMCREQKEVFVTCFIREKEVVRFTASIGSPFSCSPSDDPRRWKQHLERMNCDEIRQYHNHPVWNNHTCPSFNDHQSSQQYKQILMNHNNKLRSFIIYWNEIREWRIMEYDGNGNHWLTYEFDVIAQTITPVDS